MGTYVPVIRGLLPSAGHAAVAVALGILAIGLVPGGAASANEDGPQLAHLGPAVRGVAFEALADDLVPGTGYTLVTDGGAFSSTGTSSATIVADENGYADEYLSVSDTLAASRHSFDLRLEDVSGSTTLDDKAIPLSLPSISGSLCPTTSGTFTGTGLPAGAYSLSGQQVALKPSKVTVTNGTFTVTGTATAAVPATFTVTATSTTDPAATYTVPLPLETPFLAATDPANWGFWRARFTANCFSPHETITASRSSSPVAGEKAVADEHGIAHLVLDLHPSSQTRHLPAITFTGQTSHQLVTTGAGRELLGTTLSGGQRLTSTGDYWGAGRILVAPSPGYFLANGKCNPTIAYMNVDGSSTSQWSLFRSPRTGACTFGLTRGGNLYLNSSAGKTLWTSKSRGSSTGNRLMMNSDGNAYLYTATNAIIWATPKGAVAMPSRSVLKVGAALARGHYRTRGRVRFGLDSRGNIVVSRFGKTVWSRHTAGRGGTRLVLEKNGNLVLRTKHGRAVWTSHTRASLARAIVTPAGNVELVDAHGHIHWATGTGV